MATNKNYFLEKNSKTKETIYIEYQNVDGYKITPKAKREDAIKVDKIVFISPTLSEKIIKRKINLKIKRLLLYLKKLEEDDSEGAGDIRKSLMEAERLKITMISIYIKYLGNDYQNLTMKKINLIINQLRLKMFLSREKEEIIEERKGRKGR